MLVAQAAPVSGVVLAFTVLVASVALVAGLAWASRQLLGAPVGTLRALIAGVLGFAAAVGITQLLEPVQSSGHVAAFITVALGVPMIVAMIFIVVAEALVPTGTGPQPVEVIRGTRRAYARSRRYSQITRIAVRHGLGPYLRGRRQGGADSAGGRAALALSLRRALEEGGVTFTKLGQLLSTRRDLLPEEFTSELAKLQDRAEPAQWVDRISGALEEGKLSVNVRLFADERDRRVVTGLTNQFLLTLLSAVTGIVAVLLIAPPRGPQLSPTVSLYQVIGYNLLIVASILVLRVLFAIFRNR